MVAFGTVFCNSLDGRYAVVVTSQLWTLGVPTGFVPFVGFPTQTTSLHIFLNTDSLENCDGR
jgi:hypothetical protein